jgi:hypothetical protein
MIAAHRATPSTKAAGVTTGISRNGLSASKSRSPLTIRSACPLTASSSQAGSRTARYRLVELGVRPVPSLLRGFSTPVKLTGVPLDRLKFLALDVSERFARREAGRLRRYKCSAPMRIRSSRGGANSDPYRDLHLGIRVPRRFGIR